MRFVTLVLLLLCLLLAVLSCGSGDDDDDNDDDSELTPILNWAALTNPILSREDRMLKDQAVVYRNGYFYIFASQRFDDDDPQADGKKKMFYRTPDFTNYETFQDPDLPNGVGSPDVSYHDGVYYMVYQYPVDNYVGDEDAFRRLFLTTSTDLIDWTPPQELAPWLHRNDRTIDGALGFVNGYFFLGYKRGQMFYVSRSLNKQLDGQWLPGIYAAPGGLFDWAENYQFIKIDGVWHMVATSKDELLSEGGGNEYTAGHAPYIYQVSGNGETLAEWSRWTNKRRLEVPQENWNQMMYANCGFLCDWREYDGYFYLFYAGANDSVSFQGRGHGKIGVARSRDLITWKVAGDTSE